MRKPLVEVYEVGFRDNNEGYIKKKTLHKDYKPINPSMQQQKKIFTNFQSKNTIHSNSKTSENLKM